MNSADLHGKRYWLVGASEGLGLALAGLMHRAGADLVLSARSQDRLAEAAAGLPGVRVLALDVADQASVDRAAAVLGPVDGVVYLAGVYWLVFWRDWRAEQVTAMCEVNFTGCARVLGAVLPGMVARGAGHVVIIGSLSGFRGLPGAIGYAASKAGVMVLAESLPADLRGTGVRVQLANPGFIRTRLTVKNDLSMPFLMSPQAAAAEIFGHMRQGGFKRSFPTGFSWLFRGAQFWPDWAYYRLFAPISSRKP